MLIVTFSVVSIPTGSAPVILKRRAPSTFVQADGSVVYAPAFTVQSVASGTMVVGYESKIETVFVFTLLY